MDNRDKLVGVKEEADQQEFESVFASVAENTDEQDAAQTAYSEHISELGLKLSSLFSEAERDRQQIEQEWLKDLRQYKGQYDPEIKQKLHPKRSKAYLSVTKTKTKTVTARMIDILFPSNGGKNWGIRPTPLPDLSPDLANDIIEQYVQQTGQVPTDEDIKMVVFDEAKRRSDAMQKVIEDQLAELKYREIIRKVVHSGNLYGTGILKGPMIKKKVNKRWVKTPTGWSTIKIESLVPYCEDVSIWDIYPDMSVSDVDNAQHVFQRHLKSKHQLYELAKRKDFDGERIKAYITAHEDGTATQKQHETNLQDLSQDGEIGTVAQFNKKGKYELIEFWGYLTVDELQGEGVEDLPEDENMVAANVWILDNVVIKAVVSPLEGVRFPYYFYYYDKDETSIFGEGIPRAMRDSQSLFNASVRAMLDNAAISAGPLIEANTDLLAIDEDPTDIFPFRVFQRSGQGVEANSKAITVTTLPSYTADFMQMVQFFLNAADEVTAVPRYLHGDNSMVGGAGKTATGLSMLMGQANITLKDQIKYFDDGITSPFIRGMYYWNMDFNPKQNIKGDYEVVAEGSTSLIAKEVQAEQLNNFLALTNNEIDMQYINRDVALRLVAKSMDLDELNLIKTPDQVASEQKARSEQMEKDKQWQMQLEEMKAESGGHYNKRPTMQMAGVDLAAGEIPPVEQVDI